MRRGEPTSAFVRSRLERLLRPSLVFLGFWLVVQVALHLFDIGGAAGPRLVGETRLLRGMYPPAATLPFGPLWFLGFYLVVVCVAPATIWLHRRYRWWVPAFMVVGAIVVDIVGFGADLHRVPLPERGVRAAAPAPARALLRRRDVRAAAAEGVLGDGGRRARWPRPDDHAVGVRAVRFGPVRLVPRHRPLPQELARHRRGVRLERLPAHGLLPAGGHLVDRRRDAAPPDAHPLARTPSSLEGDDLPERRDHDAVPVAHDRVLRRPARPVADRRRAPAGQHRCLVAAPPGRSSACRRWCSPASWRSSDGSNGLSGVLPQRESRIRLQVSDPRMPIPFGRLGYSEGATAWCAKR